VVVADSREQVVLDLEVKSERKVESQARVLGEVHRVLDLACGPALHLASGWSPMLSKARDVRDLGEGDEK